MVLQSVMRSVALLVVLGGLAGCAGVPAAQQPYQPGVASGATMMLIGTQCSAGFYQCALPVAGQVGTGCSCPGLGGPSFGVIR